MRIVFMGPQGAGKGTQARDLACYIGARYLALGDMVRAEIASGTQLGRAMQQYNDHGFLVPDDLIAHLIEPLGACRESWVLDGYPRTRIQAGTLDTMLQAAGVQLDHVIWLRASDATVVARLAGRRQSMATDRVYHLEENPPPPDDPGPFVQRADDTPRRIRQRLAIYHRETEPLQSYYAARGLLRPIDADAPLDAVQAAVRRVVGAAATQEPQAVLMAEPAASRLMTSAFENAS